MGASKDQPAVSTDVHKPTTAERKRSKAEIQKAIDAFRGSATTHLTTDEIMQLTRGWDEEPPGVLAP